MSGFSHALAAARQGHGPETVALMRVLGEAETEAQARDALRTALDSSEGLERTRVERLLALWDAHPQAWAVVRGTLGGITHQRPASDPAATLTYWAETFDRLVAATPEGSVALYSLGSPTLLAAATDEIIARMGDWGLIRTDRDVLDLGCGIGRFVQALAPRVRHVTGLDIAAGMIAEARRRCAALPNVTLQHMTGQNLDVTPDRSLDLVLAADVFPYLVEAGDDLVAMFFKEAARTLRPGGVLLILNYSYRGDRDADRGEVRRHAAEAFAVERDGTADFHLWDGATFLLRVRSQA